MVTFTSALMDPDAWAEVVKASSEPGSYEGAVADKLVERSDAP